MTSIDCENYSTNHEQPPLGEVYVATCAQVVDRKGREYTQKEVLVGDESNANPELRDWYLQQGNELEAYLKDHPELLGTKVRRQEIVIPEDNPAACWLYLDEDGDETQMTEWAKNFPNAIALEPLQRLADGGAWMDAGKLDDRTLELFTNMVDGIGMRNRARIYTQSLIEHAEQQKLDSLVVVSLGSGASVPNAQATERLEEQGRAVHWTFFDLNPDALRFAQTVIGEKEFRYSTFDYGPTIQNSETGEQEPQGQSYKQAFELEDGSVDVIDALGLWEYLRPTQAVEFLKELYPKLKPGGKLIVSNMTPDRPQLEFNKRAVGWPGLHLRDESALLDLIEKAGINTQCATFTKSEDGVYIVMEIEMPEC